MSLNALLAEELELHLSASSATAVRKGWRRLLKDQNGEYDLSHHLAGQIPYFYRTPANIADDFRARHNAIDMVADLATKVPTSESFQRSHFGEILCALYLEEILGLRRLYSKLTLLTSENTNAHKMDGFFVDTGVQPFNYFAVEAKCSVLPTAVTTFSGHRHGILKQMIGSLHSWTSGSARFDYVAIRDHLEQGVFSDSEKQQIKRDLTPPGPSSLYCLGMAAINTQTVCAPDDDYILTEPCSREFHYRCLVVSNLAQLANTAYAKVLGLNPATEA